jgi:hypothetical protein
MSKTKLPTRANPNGEKPNVTRSACALLGERRRDALRCFTKCRGAFQSIATPRGALRYMFRLRSARETQTRRVAMLHKISRCFSEYRNISRSFKSNAIYSVCALPGERRRNILQCFTKYCGASQSIATFRGASKLNVTRFVCALPGERRRNALDQQKRGI